MKKFLSLLLVSLCAVVSWADKIETSTTLPDAGKPEHVYTMVNAGGYYANASTAPTQTAENYGLFAFYAVDGVDNAYYIYSHKANKWLSYTKASGYNNGTNFLSMSDTKPTDAYFKVNNYAEDYYEVSPITTGGTVDKYLNWYQGIGANTNPLDGSVTLGLWKDSGSADNGSRWTFSEVVIVERAYKISITGDATISIDGKTYANGDTYAIEGSVQRSDITAVAPAGQFAVVVINDEAQTINVSFVAVPEQPACAAYTNAVVYPAQQEAVGVAKLEQKDNVYTLSNNVLAASFIKVGDALFFGGSKAMDLEAGTEIFSVAFGSGTTVYASAMTLKSVEMQDLVGEETAVKGAKHFNGKQLVANYEYTYQESVINIVWRAVLRDGSHYLRTEMELTGVDDVDMFNVIPLAYNVDTKAAGSTPKVVGNTRGAVLMSDKIFAGLEHPVAYNTVGGATGEEDLWQLTTTKDPLTFAAASWIQVPESEVPYRVTEATGVGYPNIYAYKQTNVALTAGQKVEVKVEFVPGSGNHRLNFCGVDLLDSNGAIVANDYHSGFSGNQAENNVFTFVAPNDGTFTIRVMVEDKSEPIDASSTLTTKIYTQKEGVVVNTDVVGIQGRWSRNTTLAAGETWKISGVVGLIAQDGEQANENIHKSQKRRSFLSYSERERAVPWRAFPCYIAWYELQINRNNAADPKDNTKAEDVLDVLENWKKNFYEPYGMAPNSFIIDDGWDNYGTWTFHSNFPNEMRDMAKLAEDMGAGVGAWLGPVGGYGVSGNYRRAYWNGKGGMQLSNPAYYQVFKDAAYNLVKNQGDYRFFKFDGISEQFSATGPDNGDTGNENAEGIIRLERYVREELKEDIFFNTTVGTWASPFWFQFTDAVWRQENDYDVVGDNTIKREKWITYRDRLVYQNFIQNSPICPINTLMTHGFILTNFGPPANPDNDSYEAILRELRCAFACGSGMVELYNDYSLMNSVNGGALWADLAECIKWQQKNVDVLPDAHWVGGHPWTGSKSEVYGWAAWNGRKACLTLRNGANDAQTYTTTLREALNIPANITGEKYVFTQAFAFQDQLQGFTTGQPIDIDATLTLTLPGSSVFVFDGIISTEYSDVAEKFIADTKYIADFVEEMAPQAGVLPFEVSSKKLCALKWQIMDLPADAEKAAQRLAALPKAEDLTAENFINEESNFLIRNTRSGNYATSTTVSNLTGQTSDITSGEDFVWKIEKAGETVESITPVKIYNLGKKQYLNDISGNSYTASADAAKVWYVKNVSGTYAISSSTTIEDGTATAENKTCWNSQNNGTTIGYWNFDAGSVWNFEAYKNDDVTGVESAVLAGLNKSAVIYDLQGRKLNAVPAQGLYIKNGKKYFVN